MKTKNQMPFQTAGKHLSAILLSSTLFLLFSFTPGDKEKPDPGVIVKELISGSTFQSVIINGNISVIMTNEPAGTATIEGNENDVNKLTYKIKNNELIIETGLKKKSRQLTIYLSANMLKHMLINGNGHISSTGTIRTDDLSIWLNGVVNVNMNIIGKVSVDANDGYDLSWKPTSKKP